MPKSQKHRASIVKHRNDVKDIKMDCKMIAVYKEENITVSRSEENNCLCLSKIGPYLQSTLLQTIKEKIKEKQ